MPIELEKKFVLRVDGDIRSQLSVNESFEKQFIAQSYLGGGARIRSITGVKKPKYIFTYKKSVVGVDGDVEIEVPITEMDYTLLLSTCDQTLRKYRFKEKSSHEDCHWDIDFFLTDEDELYFAMAECELHNGNTQVPYIPDFVSNNLVFEVPLDDNRFTSKKLCDVEYATKLYREIS